MSDKLGVLYNQMINNNTDENVQAFNDECLRTVFFIPAIDVSKDKKHFFCSPLFIGKDATDLHMMVQSSYENCIKMKEEKKAPTMLAVAMNIKQLAAYSLKVEKGIALECGDKICFISGEKLSALAESFDGQCNPFEIPLDKVISVEEEPSFKTTFKLDANDKNDCYAIMNLN